MIYLSSPYSHADPDRMAERFLAVCKVAGILIGRGVHVFAAISHSHPIALAGDLGLGWEFWKGFDLDMLTRCDELWVVDMDGWRESVGVGEEIAWAKQNDKPVRLVDMFGNDTKVLEWVLE